MLLADTMADVCLLIPHFSLTDQVHKINEIDPDRKSEKW